MNHIPWPIGLYPPKIDIGRNEKNSVVRFLYLHRSIMHNTLNAKIELFCKSLINNCLDNAVF
jgi:hypothetical protein